MGEGFARKVSSFLVRVKKQLQAYVKYVNNFIEYTVYKQQFNEIQFIDEDKYQGSNR